MTSEICAFWAGGPLGLIERSCLSSFLAAGHDAMLFALNDADGAPPGVTLRDAREIAAPRVGEDEDAFRDRFRYRLLAARPGAIWADIHMCLLAPLEVRDGYLFGYESDLAIGTGILALPADSPALAALLEAPGAAPALTRALAASGEISHARPRETFYPVRFADRPALLARGAPVEETCPGARAVHLFGRRLAAEMPPAPKYWSPIGRLTRRFAASPPAAAQRVCIVTTMKNEGPFILEWIAHHRAIGVTDFVVYTNDCDDGTDALHDLLARKGVISAHLDNPFRASGKKPQHAALHDAMAHPAVRAADWVIPMDVDEFINIHVGAGTFGDLLAAAPDANMISLPWRLFGDGFSDGFRDGFVTEQFLRCAPKRCRKPHQAWGFKTAFRDIGAFRKFGVHRPVGLADGAGVNWVDGSGRPMPEEYLNSGWRMTRRNWGYDLVTLNHYAVRSAESFLVKRDRGRVNHVDRDQGLGYWFRMNHNAEEDSSILRRAEATRAEFGRLMADPEIKAAHRACVAAHRAKIAELMGRADYLALYREITGARMRNLSRMLHAFGSETFLNGPSAAPPELLKLADEMESV